MPSDLPTFLEITDCNTFLLCLARYLHLWWYDIVYFIFKDWFARKNDFWHRSLLKNSRIYVQQLWIHLIVRLPSLVDGCCMIKFIQWGLRKCIHILITWKTTSVQRSLPWQLLRTMRFCHSKKLFGALKMRNLLYIWVSSEFKRVSSFNLVS